MLEPVLGSTVREQVLLFIHSHGEGYAREIARYYDAPLDSVQKQLKRLAKGSVLTFKKKGRTLVYRFSEDCEFLPELCGLLSRVCSADSSEMRRKIIQRRISRRSRTRRKVARVVIRCYNDSL